MLLFLAREIIMLIKHLDTMPGEQSRDSQRESDRPRSPRSLLSSPSRSTEGDRTRGGSRSSLSSPKGYDLRLSHILEKKL